MERPFSPCSPRIARGRSSGPTYELDLIDRDGDELEYQDRDGVQLTVDDDDNGYLAIPGGDDFENCTSTTT